MIAKGNAAGATHAQVVAADADTDAGEGGELIKGVGHGRQAAGVTYAGDHRAVESEVAVVGAGPVGVVEVAEVQ